MYDLVEMNMKSVLDAMPEYKDMIDEINENLPELHRASSLFYKTQSQFMDNMLTVSHPTPIRNIRQILAEITRSRQALEEAYYKNKKKNIEIKMIEEKIGKCDNFLEIEMMKVEIEEKNFELRASRDYIGGAIRKVANYIEQYNSILKKKGVSDFNEIDFEKEEERYHIMKAFDQALTAARSRPGFYIDEGNHIYFSQIGINGGVAQREVAGFLAKEAGLLNTGDPGYDLILEFLNKMADKFEGCSEKLARHKGMTTMTEKAALINGDDRLKIEKKNQEKEC
jgi:hypothetical protein